MWRAISSKRYKRNYKRICQHKDFKEEELNNIINLLLNGEILPPKYHDHALKGNLGALRECHIAGNILLIYQREEKLKEVLFVDIGSHPDLF